MIETPASSQTPSSEPSFIHPSSVVESTVQLGNGVHIGPFCHLQGEVVLDANVRLISHVSVAGRTHIGRDTVIYPFASIGHPPQDLKYHGEPSRVVIGKNNTLREYVTIQPGTEGGGMITQIGDHCLLMALSHVAHDCILGSRVILANGATLAGHVTIEDGAIIGGLSGIHQFVRIGAHAIVGGMSAIEHDVIPYATVKGPRAQLNGINIIGLRRRGLTREVINDIQEVYRALFEDTSDTLKERAKKILEQHPDDAYITQMVSFVLRSERGLCFPPIKG